MTEYRIDDLAREAGTTTRNVRVYLDSGLLPRPQRRGRTAIYTDEHLTRLQAVIRLLGQGFTVKHILKFITGVQRGQGLVEVLDLDDLGGLVTEPFSRAKSLTMTRAQLEARLGELPDGTVRQLIADDIIEPAEDGHSYLVRDGGLVDDFAKLVSRGMPLSGILATNAVVDHTLDEAARALSGAAHAEVVRQRGTGWYPGDDAELAWAADLVDVMRRVARRRAHASLDRALDQATRMQLRQYKEQHDDTTAKASGNGPGTSDTAPTP
ncbi:MerR family transcriptional regulator [Mycobacterium yunnanensis]|uniref:MerR family transcriptional regulator n=1 Tax=Mycobacterium yunnanensis TaxID=368477 RepID=A0A9X3BSY0_9MYCO|nr:MerR family transcriptional regulator [Mycobacterium yunnanensis]MCV7420545.1 MerR family transcriptional regulator [Mycobacterium yunnanensis]